MGERRWSLTGSDYRAKMIRFALMNAVRKWPPQKEWVMILIAAPPSFGSSFPPSSSPPFPPLSSLRPVYPSVPSLFKFIFSVHLFLPSPPSRRDARFLLRLLRRFVRRDLRGAGMQPGWALHTNDGMTRSPLQSGWKGGGREMREGGGVLSREATSSVCVESIFSSVNRGIPAHWSWLHGPDGLWREAGDAPRSAATHWMWMSDTSI